ncbi:MAG: hypothetical protein AAFQ41_15530, partial [Cyanobacteria bacterium J06623_7]
SFEVSSSTISRFLKNKLTTTEYEDLIQQKRLARTPRGEKKTEAKSNSGKAKSTAKKKTRTKAKAETKTRTKTKAKTTKRKTKQIETVAKNADAIPELAVAENLQQQVAEEIVPESAPQKTTRTRRRRRSSASAAELLPDTVAPSAIETSSPETVLEQLVLDDVRDKSQDKSEPQTPPKSDRLILKSDRFEPENEDEDDDNEMDIITLKEMLGEDLEDINDEEEEDDDWDEDDDTTYTSPSSLSDIEILPLSQAALPRICYLVIDRSAELIVKPLAEFADLGIIPDTETNQRTLPVFDNHRIAKRFSHRRERVIKVPDGRMLQKTSHHLQGKGITRLLIDGKIYSLLS